MRQYRPIYPIPSVQTFSSSSAGSIFCSKCTSTCALAAFFPARTRNLNHFRLGRGSSDVSTVGLPDKGSNSLRRIVLSYFAEEEALLLYNPPPFKDLHTKIVIVAVVAFFPASLLLNRHSSSTLLLGMREIGGFCLVYGWTPDTISYSPRTFCEVAPFM